MNQLLCACSVLLCVSGLAACERESAKTADDPVMDASNQPVDPSLDASRPTGSTSAASTPPSTSTSTDANRPLEPSADNRPASDNKAGTVGVGSSPTRPDTATPAGTAPDNTKVNWRDTDSAALTPMDQGNNESDLKITQQIRQAVMSDGSLSFTAKNVKIITVGGKVTLRGPVKTDAERAAIEAAARKVAGASIDNQLEVKK